MNPSMKMPEYKPCDRRAKDTSENKRNDQVRA
jgi:hypothetical protein